MKTLKLSMISAAVIAAMGMSSAFADAPLADNTIKSTANVIDKCRAVAGESIAFTEYDAASASTGTATLSLYCTKDADVEVKLSGNSQRKLKLSGTDGSTIYNSLNYNLYSDAGYEDVWNDSTNTVDTKGNGLLTVRTLTVFGKIDSDQDKATAGDYSDTVTVSLVY